MEVVGMIDNLKELYLKGDISAIGLVCAISRLGHKIYNEQTAAISLINCELLAEHGAKLAEILEISLEKLTGQFFQPDLINSSLETRIGYIAKELLVERVGINYPTQADLQWYFSIKKAATDYIQERTDYANKLADIHEIYKILELKYAVKLDNLEKDKKEFIKYFFVGYFINWRYICICRIREFFQKHFHIWLSVKKK